MPATVSSSAEGRCPGPVGCRSLSPVSCGTGSVSLTSSAPTAPSSRPRRGAPPTGGPQSPPPRRYRVGADAVTDAAAMTAALSDVGNGRRWCVISSWLCTGETCAEGWMQNSKGGIRERTRPSQKHPTRFLTEFITSKVISIHLHFHTTKYSQLTHTYLLEIKADNFTQFNYAMSLADTTAVYSVS